MDSRGGAGCAREEVNDSAISVNSSRTSGVGRAGLIEGLSGFWVSIAMPAETDDSALNGRLQAGVLRCPTGFRIGTMRSKWKPG